MARKRIYVAGKMNKDSPVSRGGYHDVGNMVYANAKENPVAAALRGRSWPVPIEGSGWDYVGPFTMGDDHGCAHANTKGSPHGLARDGSSVDIAVMLDRDAEPTSAEILRASTTGIDACDVLLAIVTSMDAFGTFAEVGYAFAKKKRVYVEFVGLTPEQETDLWFLQEMSIQSGATEDERRTIPFSSAYR